MSHTELAKEYALRFPRFSVKHLSKLNSGKFLKEKEVALNAVIWYPLSCQTQRKDTDHCQQLKDFTPIWRFWELVKTTRKAQVFRGKGSGFFLKLLTVDTDRRGLLALS